MTDHQSSDTPTRQVVKFSFYRIDPAWRALPPDDRESGKREFCAAVDAFAERLQVRSYSVIGMRGDADLLLWQIGDRLDDIQELATALNSTAMGPYLSMPHSFLAMTRRSVYVSAQEAQERLHLRPADSKYFFVYPFVKTREWYQLPQEERQAMMNQHIAVGRKYPSVKLNTTYSFGLDDQEFVVSFETDEPADFLDLVMELREAKTSLYTLRDTPVFSCIAMSLSATLDSLGAPGDAISSTSSQQPAGDVEWLPVASAAELPAGSTKVVYYRGDQVALYNVAGKLYAIGNRCSHANGPLADGVIEGEAVICPYHDSKFDLNTGEPLRAPASRRLPVYEVKIENGAVLLAPAIPENAPAGK
jgi:chlorite dismutase